MFNNGCYGSSTRGTRFKPEHLDNKRWKSLPWLAATGNPPPPQALQLSPVEAFYLVLIKRIKIYHVFSQTNNDEKYEINPVELWQILSNPLINPYVSFRDQFAAYSYFRSSGWIPKNGTQYASDFVLYERDPDDTHSLYTVMLIPEELDGQMSLQTILRQLRVALQNRKVS